MDQTDSNPEGHPGSVPRCQANPTLSVKRDKTGHPPSPVELRRLAPNSLDLPGRADLQLCRKLGVVQVRFRRRQLEIPDIQCVQVETLGEKKVNKAKKIIVAFAVASLVAAPAVLADPPDKERKEAYKERMKEEREYMKRQRELEKEDRKRYQETEREDRKRHEEMQRERRKHREEMEREDRKHLEEMEREDRKHLEEMEREERKHREEMEREERKRMKESRREEREYRGGRESERSMEARRRDLEERFGREFGKQ